MKSGLFKQLRSIFFTRKEKGHISPVNSPMSDNKLPDFKELKQVKGGLPSFTELKAPSKKPPTPEQIAKNKASKKKEKPVRTKLAKTLDTIRPLVSGVGHALFYRYIRLADENNQGLPGPKGGACILVNMVDGNTFSFSFAVCSPEDAFVKDQSRALCQQRMMQGVVGVISFRDPNSSCYENILMGIESHLLGRKEDRPFLALQSTKITRQQLKLLAKFINEHYRNDGTI